eukprot:4646855-Amphidinium_carterae.1
MAQGQAAVPVLVTNLPAAPFVVGPHLRVVEHATYAQCLDCNRHVEKEESQTGTWFSSALNAEATPEALPAGVG